MKIAVLVYGLERIGGIKKHALSLCREYVALGHQVDVWCVEYDRVNCYPNLVEGFQIHALRPARQLEESQTRKMLRGGIGAYLQTLWGFYEDQRQLSAIIPAGYDVIHPHGNMTSWAAAEYKRKYGTPVVWLSNDFIPIASFRGNHPEKSLQALKRGLLKMICAPIAAYDRWAVRSIDRIAVLRELVRTQIKDYYRRDAAVIRAGIDLPAYLYGDRCACRACYGVKDETFLILSVCSLMPHRRLEDIIHAVRDLVRQGQDVMYLIVGRTSQDPAYAEYLHREVQACGLTEEHVRFAGEVSERELVDCYHASDAFVWASDENQTWGLAGMEAMAARKPVIVSDASGLAEVLTDGENALLVSPRSPDAIAASLNKLIANPQWAVRLGCRAQQLVRENFSWQKNAAEMVALFEEASVTTRQSRGAALLRPYTTQGTHS